MTYWWMKALDGLRWGIKMMLKHKSNGGIRIRPQVECRLEAEVHPTQIILYLTSLFWFPCFVSYTRHFSWSKWTCNVQAICIMTYLLSQSMWLWLVFQLTHMLNPHEASAWVPFATVSSSFMQGDLHQTPKVRHTNHVLGLAPQEVKGRSLIKGVMLIS
jgi:hypothetical protein